MITKNAFSYIPLFVLLLGTSVFAQNNAGYLTDDTIQLKEVIIDEGSKEKITGSLSGRITLHADGVKTLPSLMGNVDMLKILELTPGVQTTGEGNSNLYVRGGDPGQNLLLYNGNVIYSPGHAIGLFPLFNQDHISSVELLKSGVNAQYGNYLSSVIAVRSRESIPEKTSVKGNVGLLSAQATLELAINDKFGAYITARKTFLELLLKPILKIALRNESNKTDLDGMGYDFYDSNITLIGKLSPTNKLIVDAFVSGDDLFIKEESIHIDGSLKWNNRAFSAKLQTNINENTVLEQTLLYTYFNNKLNMNQTQLQAQVLSTVEDIGYKNKLKYIIMGLPFESGLQYTYHNLLPQKSNVENTGVSYQQNTIDRNLAHDVSVFTSSSIRFESGFYLEPGLRYNLFTSQIKGQDFKIFHSVDARIFARYQLKENIFFRAGASHNTQYINKITPSSIGLPTDFWVAASNIVLPQTGNEISVGYYHSFLSQAFEISADAYFRNMKNVTEYNFNLAANDTGSFADKIYYGKGKAYGIELMLKKNAGKFTGWVSYSLGRSERNFVQIDNGKTFPAKYDRTHDLSITGTYAFSEKWDASMVFVYATGNAYTQPSSWYFINNLPVKEYGEYNGVRMPNYNRTDISVNYWFKKDNGLNLSVYNMFMVRNPIYIFMTVKEEAGKMFIDRRRKTLYTIMPSISWRFKF